MNKIYSQSDSADTLVVMVSPAAVPESFDILSLAGCTTEETEKRLCRCINRFCRIADKGDYVPDNMIHVYQYSPDDLARLCISLWISFRQRRDGSTNRLLPIICGKFIKRHKREFYSGLRYRPL